ncbi:hypothetical protein [Streptomyces sp. NPDC002908]|uniref:hypothetical protein n=1 Tax=Streptomyces sp. NPDC002908 TaxID=3364670 RepID=UPI0036A8C04B
MRYASRLPYLLPCTYRTPVKSAAVWIPAAVRFVTVPLPMLESFLTSWMDGRRSLSWTCVLTVDASAASS